MGYSLDKQVSNPVEYKAPDPLFITTVQTLSQVFPWDRFERFFESQPLINASAQEQLFLMRVLAIQEVLCLGDADVLRWLKNQMHIFAFISSDYQPKLPNEAVLNTFRRKLNDLNILEPFRLRCQEGILKYGQPLSPSELLEFADFDAFLLYTNHSENTQFDIELLATEEKWVTCPVCNSSALDGCLPDNPTALSFEIWASCKQCNHKFKLE